MTRRDLTNFPKRECGTAQPAESGEEHYCYLISSHDGPHRCGCEHTWISELKTAEDSTDIVLRHKSELVSHTVCDR